MSFEITIYNFEQIFNLPAKEHNGQVLVGQYWVYGSEDKTDHLIGLITNKSSLNSNDVQWFQLENDLSKVKVYEGKDFNDTLILGKIRKTKLIDINDLTFIKICKSRFELISGD